MEQTVGEFEQQAVGGRVVDRFVAFDEVLVAVRGMERHQLHSTRTQHVSNRGLLPGRADGCGSAVHGERGLQGEAGLAGAGRAVQDDLAFPGQCLLDADDLGR